MTKWPMMMVILASAGLACGGSPQADAPAAAPPQVAKVIPAGWLGTYAVDAAGCTTPGQLWVTAEAISPVVDGEESAPESIFRLDSVLVFGADSVQVQGVTEMIYTDQKTPTTYGLTRDAQGAARLRPGEGAPPYVKCPAAP